MKHLSALLSIAALAGAYAAQQSRARLGVKGNKYDIDGYNPAGFDVFGFSAAGLNQSGKAAGDFAAVVNVNRFEEEASGGASLGERDVAVEAASSTSSTETQTNSTTTDPTTTRPPHPTRTRRPKPPKPTITPHTTPIPYTTINGTVMPHPTYVFPEPTTTDICYGGIVAFIVRGVLDDFGVQMYLAQAARLAAVPEGALVAGGYDYRVNTNINVTEITVLICDRLVFDAVSISVQDSRLADGWRRIGTMEVAIIPFGEPPIIEIFMCPTGSYLTNNRCDPCQSPPVDNCTLTYCTNSMDATCAAGSCDPGFYNETPGSPSNCLPCVPVLNCQANSTICTEPLNGRCTPDGCNPGYVTNPAGACVII